MKIFEIKGRKFCEFDGRRVFNKINPDGLLNEELVLIPVEVINPETGQVDMSLVISIDFLKEIGNS